MYEKLQAKLTAKEFKINLVLPQKHCLFLCPGQYLDYFTAFSQLVRLPSWPRRSCYLRIILRVQMVFKNRNIVRHNLHTFS